MRVGLIAAVVLAALTTGIAAAAAGTVVAGGTYNQSPGQPFGTIFFIQSDDLGAVPVEVTGPAAWNGGAPLQYCGDRPFGIAPNLAVCWGFMAPVSGTYSAVAPFAPGTSVPPFSIDTSTFLPNPSITGFQQSVSGVTLSWSGPPGTRSYLISLSPDPWTGAVERRVVGADTTSTTFTQVPLTIGQAYIAAVWAFPFDLRSSDPISGQLDASSNGVNFVVDTTPPTITPSVTGTLGNGGWYTSDVAVSWSVADPESGVFAQSLHGCATSTVAADTAGTTFGCFATNRGHLTGGESVTVKRDATPPHIAFAGNAGLYDVDQQIAITCSATDGGSGPPIAGCGDLSEPAYLATGAQTLTRTAADAAGNTATGSTSFTVRATATGLCRLTARFVGAGGVANSLCVKADPLAAALSPRARQALLAAYEREVRAQIGKRLTAAQVAILLRIAASL